MGASKGCSAVTPLFTVRRAEEHFVRLAPPYRWPQTWLRSWPTHHLNYSTSHSVPHLPTRPAALSLVPSETTGLAPTLLLDSGQPARGFGGARCPAAARTHHPAGRVSGTAGAAVWRAPLAGGRRRKGESLQMGGPLGLAKRVGWAGFTACWSRSVTALAGFKCQCRWVGVANHNVGWM